MPKEWIRNAAEACSDAGADWSYSFITLLAKLFVPVYFFMPIAFGAILGDIVAELHKPDGNSATGRAAANTIVGWVHSKAWSHHWEIVPVSILWLISYLLHAYVRQQDIDKRGLYRQLEYVHRRIVSLMPVDADLRCTVWMPTGRFVLGVPTRMAQWVNFVPLRSSFSVDGHVLFRHNRGEGRTVRVYNRQPESGTMQPIGFVGLSVLRSLEKQESIILTMEPLEGTGLVDYLIHEMHMTPSTARRMIQDRACFMCCSLVDEGSKKLLAVVYYDCRMRGAFDQQVQDEVEDFMPVFAELINAG
jgi:hypothetical protein